MSPTNLTRDRLLRVDQVAEMLNCDKKTVYRMVYAAQLSSLPVRKTIRILESSVLEYVRRVIQLADYDSEFFKR